MTAIVLVELGVSFVAWLVFLALSRGMWRTPAGRQLALTAAVAAGEAGSLLLLGLGVALPLWLFAVGFGLTDIVVIRWVWLRWRLRRVA